MTTTPSEEPEKQELPALLATYASLSRDYISVTNWNTLVSKENKERMDFIWREIEKRLK